LSTNIANLETWKGILWANPEWASTRSFLLIIVTFLFTLMLVIFVGEAVRKIPVVYSRRGYNENSSRTLSRVKSELPVKVNMAGVIPIIFAISFILFPSVIATFFSTSTLPQIQETALKVQTFLSTNPKDVLFRSREELLLHC
jgi:preprotein translocase subunit SecY